LRGALDQVGGIAYLSELQDQVPSAANLSYYLDIVLDKFRLRKLLAVCAEATERVYENKGEVEKLLLECGSEVCKLTEEETPLAEEHIKTVINRVVTDMEQWHYARGSAQIRGLPTGPPGNYLDKVLMGIRPTDYITLAGRPGDGKSSLAMNIVEYLAKDYVWFEPTGKKILNELNVEVAETVRRVGIPIGVFTVEMDNESLGYRLIFGRAGVDEASWNQGFGKQGDQARLTKATAELASTNIWLDDTPAQNINQIAAKARRMAKHHGIKLFVLDYLQLCTSDNPRDDERTRLDKISKKIMALKKQLGVPWLVLAQMNRNIETQERGKDRQPMLSDLAGSGSIEQDSDKVLILRRTPRREFEDCPKDKNGNETASDKQILDKVCKDWEWSRQPRRVDVWVVKNRRGPTGHAKMLFQNNLCRFKDWHQWKVENNIEERKEGESKQFGENVAEMDEEI
jgi:replicative DNA helicase